MRDMVDYGTIIIEKIDTNINPSDALTNVLNVQKTIFIFESVGYKEKKLIPSLGI